MSDLWNSDALGPNEPPPNVTRVRDAENAEAVRGPLCESCGPPHSQWAWVLVRGKTRTPGPHYPEGTWGSDWECWQDLSLYSPVEEVAGIASPATDQGGTDEHSP